MCNTLVRENILIYESLFVDHNLFFLQLLVITLQPIHHSLCRTGA